MAFLFRKISKICGWPDGKYVRFDSVKKINADAITNDLNTKNNELSWWLIENEEDFLQTASGFIGTFKSRKKVTRFVMFKTDMFASKKLSFDPDPDNGNTVFVNDKSKHFEIKELNYRKLGTIAEMIAKCTDTMNVKEVSWDDAIVSIKNKIIAKENIDYDIMGEAMKIAIAPYIDK